MQPQPSNLVTGLTVPFASFGEFIAQAVWQGLDFWLHWKILGRSWLWLVFVIAGAGASWSLSGGQYLLGFLLAVLALAVLVPAWYSED